MTHAVAYLVVAMALIAAGCGGAETSQTSSARSFTESDLAALLRGEEDAPSGTRLHEGAAEPRPRGEIETALGVTPRRLRELGFLGARDEAFVATDDETDGALGLVLVVRGAAESLDALDLLRGTLEAELDTPAEDDAADLAPLVPAVSLGDESHAYVQLNGDVTEGKLILWRRGNAVFVVRSGSDDYGIEFAEMLDRRAIEVGKD